ncbi:FTR1 family protein [Paenibacillus sp. CC-CFT747]|nr:FTR1 family protein [Paenibacillus sp. CC-CFT747]
MPYSIVDVIAVMLREAWEALLIVILLIGFVTKTRRRELSRWIWLGAGAGIAASLLLGAAVRVLFTSGRFLLNPHLTSGVTGLFAAAMLLHLSLWMRSRYSLACRRQDISHRSSNALTSGSFASLALLAFGAVFREGMESVLCFAGLASSIDRTSLAAGTGLVLALWAAVAYLAVKRNPPSGSPGECLIRHSGSLPRGQVSRNRHPWAARGRLPA